MAELLDITLLSRKKVSWWVDNRTVELIKLSESDSRCEIQCIFSR